jgi:hypothetical protein
MRFRLLIFVLAVLCTVSGVATAQPEPEPKDGKVTIAMTLHPTALPVPLSKINLITDYDDLQPGNRVQGLLKVFMEQDTFFKMAGTEEWYNKLSLPLKDFPVDRSIENGIAYPEKYTRMMGYLDRGARYKTIEWNEYFELRKDGFYLLLPEVQKMRQLSSVARYRMRGEIKQGRFDRAAETAKSIFGIAEALEQHPCLIGYLVCIAIATQAQIGIEEMVQQPGCPNLFWALTKIPQPMFSMKLAFGGERMFVMAQMTEFMKPTRALGDAELDSILSNLDEMLRMESSNPMDRLFQSVKIRYALIGADSARMEKCRQRLIAEGCPAAVVKSLPLLQVAIADDLYRYEILRDELFKPMSLPYYEAEPWIRKAEDAIKKAKSNGDIIGPALLPAVWNVKRAQARYEQRMGLLRCVEAVRLYAHANGGKLPESLAATGLPLPKDPISGQPFTYSVKDGVASLHGADPKTGERAFRHYELRIAK